MSMDGISRRKAIVEYLRSTASPVSGTKLAERFHVSRQVIVQDIALLRAQDSNIMISEPYIMSTNKGYILFHPQDKRTEVTAVIVVKHSDEQTLEEMRAIVDYGGRMLDISVDHDLYGQIRVDLLINDMEDAEEFCQKMLSSNSRPLKVLTEDCHYHTIAAPSEKALQMIQNELQEKGFLLLRQDP